LGALLKQARETAGLSLQALSGQTKIQLRLLEAMERGDLRELPSPAHGRGFVRNVAHACGAAEAEALALFDESLRALRAEAQPQPLTQAAPPAVARKEALPAGHPAAVGDARAGFGRLAALAAVGILLLVVLLSVARQHAFATKPAPALASQATAENPPSGPAAGQAAEAATPAGAKDAEDLVLRANRATWVSLVVDGEALPLVALAHGEKRHFQVRARAVALLADAGAVRVWWRGENLGYLGAKGSQANGLVFEHGMKWHKDSAQDLAQPEGAPAPEAADDSATSASDGALGD
jgi:cytoskeletal protein RodZ